MYFITADSVFREDLMLVKNLVGSLQKGYFKEKGQTKGQTKSVQKWAKNLK